MCALAAAGAPLDAAGQRELTPLHYAVRTGNCNCVAALLRCGADAAAILSDAALGDGPWVAERDEDLEAARDAALQLVAAEAGPNWEDTSDWDVW